MVRVECTCDCAGRADDDFKKDIHGGDCEYYQARTKLEYPELAGNKIRGNVKPPVVYPDECPACGAETVDDHGFSVGTDSFPTREYACGGKYEPKPQIQNHTDYFWGSCGKRKDLKVRW